MEVVAIVGSRNYCDLMLVRSFVQRLPSGTIIVSGGARGVDNTAEDEARKRGLGVISIPADWGRHGKKAGVLRNRWIVWRADRVVAFWDGESRGTAHTIGHSTRSRKAFDHLHGN